LNKISSFRSLDLISNLEGKYDKFVTRNLSPMSKTDFEAESTIEIFVNLRKDQKQTMVQIQATPSAE
jgi:hypothetical protein